MLDPEFEEGSVKQLSVKPLRYLKSRNYRWIHGYQVRLPVTRKSVLSVTVS